MTTQEASLPDTVPGTREVSQEYDVYYKSYADADGETDSIDVAHTKHGGADAIMSSLAEMLTAGGEKNASSMNIRISRLASFRFLSKKMS